MNAVSGIFVALAIIFGGGFVLEKIYVAVKTAAVERIHRGQPSLMSFTNKLTCSKISKDGNLEKASCNKRSK